MHRSVKGWNVYIVLNTYFFTNKNDIGIYKAFASKSAILENTRTPQYRNGLFNRRVWVGCGKTILLEDKVEHFSPAAGPAVEEALFSCAIREHEYISFLL